MLHHPCTAYNRPLAVPERRTFVVFGQHRGGTSMAAGLLRLFGVHLGEQLDPGNNEDVEFRTRDVRQILALIAERDRAHDVWGFKDPASFLTAPAWYPRLRAPYFVAVVRDALACAQGEVRRGVRPDVLATACEKHREQGVLLDFLTRLRDERRPLLLISYERAVHNADLLVDSLAEFAGIVLPDDFRARAIEYVTPERGHGDPDKPAGVSLETLWRAKEMAAREMGAQS